MGWNFDISDDVPCMRTSWTVHRDSHVSEGRSGSSATLPSCQSECITDTACTGIDWFPAADVKCWLHGSWSADNQLNTYQGVDHYDLTRLANCHGKHNSHTCITLYIWCRSYFLEFSSRFHCRNWCLCWYILTEMHNTASFIWTHHSIAQREYLFHNGIPAERSNARQCWRLNRSS